MKPLEEDILLKNLMNLNQMTIVKLDGTRHENVSGSLVGSTIIIPAKSIDVASGYRIEVLIPNSPPSTYLVEEVKFIRKLSTIPAHYQVTVRHLPETSTTAPG